MMSPNDFLTSLNIVNGTRDLPELRAVFLEHMKRLSEHAKDLAPKPEPVKPLPPAQPPHLTLDASMRPKPQEPPKPVEHPLYSDSSSSTVRRPGGSDNAP